MSYTPTTWQTGDTITAEKLNNMESGIAANAGYLIPLDFSGGVISVPADKMVEVDHALLNTETFNILGCKFSGGGALAGHRINNGVFSCPITKDIASEFGISGTASLVVRRLDDGYGNVTVEIVPDVFIVTLTPTAQDLSGTMDKTVAEINEAYEQGRKIVFRVYSSATVFNEVEVTIVFKASATYPSFNAYLIATADYTGFDGIVFAFTGRTDDGTKSTYSTNIYPLTPMS